MTHSQLAQWDSKRSLPFNPGCNGVLCEVSKAFTLALAFNKSRSALKEGSLAEAEFTAQWSGVRWWGSLMVKDRSLLICLRFCHVCLLICGLDVCCFNGCYSNRDTFWGMRRQPTAVYVGGWTAGSSLGYLDGDPWPSAAIWSWKIRHTSK